MIRAGKRLDGDPNTPTLVMSSLNFRIAHFAD
jgi:hypothetical protein